MLTFNFIDPFPHIPLDDILPVSTRAESWLARASKANQFSEGEPAQILGAVQTLCGLDYHHDQFIHYLGRLATYLKRKKAFMDGLKDIPSGSKVSPPFPTSTERAHLTAFRHEAIAYLNRLGQFYYFAKSKKLDHILVRSNELLVFRHKHTAHRSIDQPKGEPLTLREMHAMAFDFHVWNADSFPVFQINDGEQHIFFHMKNDHPLIMEEVFRLLQTLYPVALNN